MKTGSAATMRKVAATVWGHAHLVFPLVAVVTIFRGHMDLLVPALLPNGDNTHHMMSQFAINASYAAHDAIWGPQSFDYGMPLFRFYQPLFYLMNLAVFIVTDASPMLLHNLAITLFFSASPLTMCYGLRKVGVPRFAAGLAAMMAMTSVGGFGNSIEAYNGNGIATQSVAAFFFPLFLGTFAGFLRGENRTASAAILFSLTFLSHVVMAVLAVLAGALYFLVTPFSVRRVWRRVLVFGGLVACMVAFWLLPFLSHTVEFRPIPDSEIRPDKRWWFVGASDDELARVVESGRLFDDPRVKLPPEKDPLDKLVDQLNITPARHYREPIVTWLVGWGLLVGLLLLRRPGPRFLVAGLLFSLLLMAGQDDHPWLGFIPFVNYIQSFRTTYFVEFFAFGLVGLGIERPLYLLVKTVARTHVALRCAVALAVLCAAAVPSKWAVEQMVAIMEKHVRTIDPDGLDAELSNASPIPKMGYPFRTDVTEVGGLMRDWLSINGYRMGITHWGKSGPNPTFKAQQYLVAHRENIAFSKLIGQRFLYADRRTAPQLLQQSGERRWRRVTDGFESQRSTKNARAMFLDSGQEELLQPLANPIVAVYCRHNQWIWLIDSWMERYGPQIDALSTPYPVRVRDGEWRGTPLYGIVDTVLYLDGEAADRDAGELAGLARDGKSVWTPFEIKGTPAQMIPLDESVWAALEESKPRDTSSGSAAVSVHRRGNKYRTSQRYAFDVEALEPSLALLPTVAVPGWRASLDGEPVEVYPVGPSLLAAALPQGDHSLIFYWRMPARDLLLTALSTTVFAVLGCFWLLAALGAISLRRAFRATLRAGGGR